MAHGTQTASQRLADLTLGGEGSLEAFVGDRRKAGESWRVIARELYETSERQVDLTHETLRAWFPQFAQVEKAS